MKATIVLLPGDGIGPDVVDSAVRVLNRIGERFGHEWTFSKQIIGGAHEVARRVLRENRDILERVTRHLLDKEVMEGDELRAMFTAPRAVNL